MWCMKISYFLLKKMIFHNQKLIKNLVTDKSHLTHLLKFFLFLKSTDTSESIPASADSLTPTDEIELFISLETIDIDTSFSILITDAFSPFSPFLLGKT